MNKLPVESVQGIFHYVSWCQLIVIEAAQELLRDLYPAKKLKIRLEVDTDPPGGFETEPFLRNAFAKNSPRSRAFPENPYTAERLRSPFFAYAVLSSRTKSA